MMPWPKGQKRGLPIYGADSQKRVPNPWVGQGGNLDGVDSSKPPWGKRIQQKLKQIAAREFVESGEHLLAEKYYPATAAKAEAAYKVAIAHEPKRRKAVATSNTRRGTDIRENIERYCADILHAPGLKRDAAVGMIIERLTALNVLQAVPGRSTAFRHLAAILGKKR